MAMGAGGRWMGLGLFLQQVRPRLLPKLGPQVCRATDNLPRVKGFPAMIVPVFRSGPY